jgi:hypothetical protein
MTKKPQKTTRELGFDEIMRRAAAVIPDKPKKAKKARMPRQKEN